MNLSTIFNFAFICVPKTGSTSVSEAIRDYSTIHYGWKHSLKHMRAQSFHDHIMPFHRDLFPNIDIETFCVIREPIDWVYSWYKYFSRDELHKISQKSKFAHKRDLYCGNISFETFVEKVVDNGTEKYAKIGLQSKYIALDSGSVGVDKIFLMQEMNLVSDFLSEKIGKKIDIYKKNVSPNKVMNISNELKSRLNSHLCKDSILYEDVVNGKYR